MDNWLWWVGKGIKVYVYVYVEIGRLICIDRYMYIYRWVEM